MAGQERWLAAGQGALAEEGPAGLKIDRLARRLGVTKGSFFHHFAGAAAYQTALLAHLEVAAEAQLAAFGDELADAHPRQLLARLTAAVGNPQGLWQPTLEVALRAWSFTDPEVRATQDRIDAQRLALLEAIWRRLEPDPERARARARLPYLILVGASMSAIEVDELQQVYELILPLVPSETGHERRVPRPGTRRS